VIPPIVDQEWAAQRDVIWLDVRSPLDGGSERGRAAYLVGHIPGARFFDLDHHGAGPPSHQAGRHPLPDPEVFAAGVAAAGIGAGDVVVAYDDTGGPAARVVWMLRAIGIDAALLNGGLAAWTGPLVAELPVVVATDPVTRPWPPELLATADEVAAGGSIVVDARAAERFRGEVEPIDAKAGHVPGAVNVPYAGNLGPDGRWLAPEALRTRFEAVGVTADGDAIVYCGSGVTACHDLLAIELAGLGRKRLYPGSWSQWSSDPARPIETGPRRPDDPAMAGAEAPPSDGTA
jgi:thiosulfate/3-mercaptopyruvate sulfurtransferase